MEKKLSRRDLLKIANILERENDLDDDEKKYIEILREVGIGMCDDDVIVSDGTYTVFEHGRNLSEE